MRKRLHSCDGVIELHAENPAYPYIRFHEYGELHVWGVVGCRPDYLVSCGRPRDGWIVDFGTTISEADSAFYEEPLEYVTRHVPIIDVLP